MTDPLIIKDWQAAIGDSAHVGFSLMRNVDIEAFPGAVKVGKKPASLFHTSTSSTFSVTAPNYYILLCDSNVSNIITTTCVRFTTTGVLPAPLAINTNYFAINLSNTTLEVATTIANANIGAYVTITDAGSGVQTVSTLNPGTFGAASLVSDPRTGNMFAQDSNGVVWYNDSSRYKVLNGNTVTAGNSTGNGLGLFQASSGTATYLFAFRSNAIDVANVFSTANLESPSWSNSWQNLNAGSGSGAVHHAIVGQDNILYYTDDRYIGSIRELTTFNPSSSGTYTWTSQALDLPQFETAQWLEELGTNLLIAGGTFNYIYPWDRSSSSFNRPLPVPENSVKRLKNIGDVVYILPGTRGNIYTTQGSYVKPFKKIPDQVSNNSGTVTASPITWGGIAQANGALMFGVATTTSGNSGVYKLYPDGRIVIDNVPSTGSANATAIYATNEFYTFGYSGGIDSFSSQTRYSSFESVVQSGLYRVATKTGKASFSELEVQIAKPASIGHIRVSYRRDTSSAFTTMDSYTADGSTTSWSSDAGLTDLENIQIQVEMDGDMELMEVRLYP